MTFLRTHCTFLINKISQLPPNRPIRDIYCQFPSPLSSFEEIILKSALQTLLPNNPKIQMERSHLVVTYYSHNGIVYPKSLLSLSFDALPLWKVTDRIVSSLVPHLFRRYDPSLCGGQADAAEKENTTQHQTNEKQKYENYTFFVRTKRGQGPLIVENPPRYISHSNGFSVAFAPFELLRCDYRTLKLKGKVFVKYVLDGPSAIRSSQLDFRSDNPNYDLSDHMFQLFLDMTSFTIQEKDAILYATFTDAAEAAKVRADTAVLRLAERDPSFGAPCENIQRHPNPDRRWVRVSDRRTFAPPVGYRVQCFLSNHIALVTNGMDDLVTPMRVIRIRD